MPEKLSKALIISSLVLLLLTGCKPGGYFLKTQKQSVSSLSGSGFYKTVANWGWRQRDSLAVKEIIAGDVPARFKKFVRIDASVRDSAERIVKAYYFVSPDYLSIGTDQDWARIPLTAKAAQEIADRFYCFLPTRKMVDDIYRHATIKLEPVPLFAYRDSSVTMWQHHLMIEGQRKERKGLIAGIKKDLVLSGRISRDPKPNREAIYGWHKLDGVPIQPLYTGHIDWYVDYSHGIRLVYRKIWVDGVAMDYIDVLKDPVLQKLLCDESDCDFYRYNTE